MFVLIKFGDDQSEIFNANCTNRNLLLSIRERCCQDTDDTLEVSDESGTVKNLHKNPADYGTQYVQDRESLVLLKVYKQQGEDDAQVYVPLLSGKERDKDFIARLNPKPATKHIHRGGSRRERDVNASSLIDVDNDVTRAGSRSSSRRNSLVGSRRSSISGRRGSKGTIQKK